MLEFLDSWSRSFRTWSNYFKFQSRVQGSKPEASLLRSVAIVGVGITELKSSTPQVSYKELIFEAAQKAYEDAGLNPRKDIESFVCSSEDFLEGTSIFDESGRCCSRNVFVGEMSFWRRFLRSLFFAYMQILTG